MKTESARRTNLIVLVFAMFIGAAAAQSAAPKAAPKQATDCVPVLRVEWLKSPDTDNPATDSITVCEDHRVMAVHRFTTPQLGNSPAEPTTWKYEGHRVEDVELSAVRSVFARSDVATLMNTVVDVRRSKTYPAGRQFTDTMTFSLPKDSRTVTLRGFLYLSCGEESDEPQPEAAKDLICLFGYLYSLAKNGEPADDSCVCKSLKVMSAGVQKTN